MNAIKSHVVNGEAMGEEVLKFDVDDNFVAHVDIRSLQPLHIVTRKFNGTFVMLLKDFPKETLNCTAIVIHQVMFGIQNFFFT